MSTLVKMENVSSGVDDIVSDESAQPVEPLTFPKSPDNNESLEKIEEWFCDTSKILLAGKQLSEKEFDRLKVELTKEHGYKFNEVPNDDGFDVYFSGLRVASDGTILFPNVPTINGSLHFLREAYVNHNKPIEQMPFSKYNEKDVELVLHQVDTTKEKAIDALEKTNGDVVEAIMLLNT